MKTPKIIEPAGNHDITLEAMWNTKGESIDVVPGSGHFVWIDLKPKGDKVFIARYI